MVIPPRQDTYSQACEDGVYLHLLITFIIKARYLSILARLKSRQTVSERKLLLIRADRF